MKNRGPRELVAELENENRQLKRTIIALRDELERQIAAHAEEIQKLHRSARDEEKHLQEMIVALRERLQNGHG